MSHPADQINQTNWKIAHGEYDEAIESLTSTLKTLKLFLSGDCHVKVAMPMSSEESNDHGPEVDQAEEKCNSSSSSSSADFDYDFFSLTNTPSFFRLSDSVANNIKRAESRNDANCTETQSPTQLMVFREPIMTLSHKTLDHEVCRELTYVCLYNLALAYHLKSFDIEPSLKASETRRAHLGKALCLYELSQMLEMERSITIRVNALHSMALVSNLRHIHNELGNMEKADMCSQHLLSTLMYLLYCGEADVLGSSIEAFYDVLLPLISKSITASAA